MSLSTYLPDRYGDHVSHRTKAQTNQFIGHVQFDSVRTVRADEYREGSWTHFILIAPSLPSFRLRTMMVKQSHFHARVHRAATDLPEKEI